MPAITVPDIRIYSIYTFNNIQGAWGAILLFISIIFFRNTFHRVFNRIRYARKCLKNLSSWRTSGISYVPPEKFFLRKKKNDQTHSSKHFFTNYRTRNRAARH